VKGGYQNRQGKDDRKRSESALGVHECSKRQNFKLRNQRTKELIGYSNNRRVLESNFHAIGESIKITEAGVFELFSHRLEE